MGVSGMDMDMAWHGSGMAKAAYLRGAIVVLTIGRIAADSQVYPEANRAEKVQWRDAGC